MKKILFVLLIISLLCGYLTACSQAIVTSLDTEEAPTSDTSATAKPNEPIHIQQSLESTVSMLVTEIDRSQNQATLTISNNSEYKIITGEHFIVEAFDGIHWRKVPWYGTFEGIFIDIGYSIEPGESMIFIKDLRLVEPLETGLYRIRKSVFRSIDTPISEGDLLLTVAEFYWDE